LRHTRSAVNPTKVIAVVSGGMDSMTLAYLLYSEGYELHLLSMNYGQRHRKEIGYAERCAEYPRST
jgi:7-cyano-7-deazaguanine synthase